MNYNNGPTWSFSQFNTFSQCKRMYFYDKYWQYMPNMWEIYKLKYITNIPMFQGNCVHDAIKSCILSYKNGKKTYSVDDAIYKFRLRFRNGYNESDRGDWLNPKKFGKKASNTINLFEHYYKCEDALEKAQEGENKGIIALKSLWNSPIFKRILSTDKEDFVTVDEDNFPHFALEHKNLSEKDKELSEITVYSVIDLALKYGDKLRIIDWKTGKRTQSNKLQLAIYALYANCAWNYEINDIKFYLCYLGENTDIVEEKIDVITVKSAYELILRSYKEMVDLYNNGEPNVANFPKTDNANLCSMCKYKELCFPGDMKP